MGRPKQEQSTTSNTGKEEKQTRKKFGFQEPEANNEVVQTLFEMAKSGKNPTVTIFWAKTKCGMVERGSKKERKAIKPPTIIIRSEGKQA